MDRAAGPLNDALDRLRLDERIRVVVPAGRRDVPGHIAFADATQAVLAGGTWYGLSRHPFVSAEDLAVVLPGGADLELPEQVAALLAGIDDPADLGRDIAYLQDTPATANIRQQRLG